MKFDFDRAVEVAGLLLGIVGLVLGLTTDKWILGGGLIILAIALPASIWFIHRRYTHLPPFTVLESQKVVTIHDAGGRAATIRKELRLRANHAGLQSYTHRNISSDGVIANFCNEFGNHPPELVSRRDAGDWEVTTYFPAQLAAGQTVNTWLEFDLADAYLNAQERSRVNVDGQFHRICVTIRSTQRPFMDASCVEYFSGMPVKQIPITFDRNRTTLEVCVEKPKRGAIYQVEWTW